MITDDVRTGEGGRAPQAAPYPGAAGKGGCPYVGGAGGGPLGCPLGYDETGWP